MESRSELSTDRGCMCVPYATRCKRVSVPIVVVALVLNPQPQPTFSIARDDSLTRHVKNIHGLDERAANCRRDASEVPPCPRILRGDARVRAGLPCKRARKTTPARLEDEDYDVPSSSSCPSTPSSSSSRLSTPRSRSLCSSPPTSDCSSLSSTPSLSDYELSAPATSPPSTPAPTTPALSPNCDDLELQYPDDFLPAYAGPLLPELDPAMLPPMEPEPLPQYERASWLADGLFDTYDNDLLGYGFERPAEYQPLDTYAPPEPDFIFDFEMELPTSYTGLDLSWPSSSGLDVSF